MDTDRDIGAFADQSQVMPTRVLLVENDPILARLVRVLLSEAPETPFQLVEAGTLADAIDMVSNLQFDCIVLDLDLPDSMNHATYVALKAEVGDMPVVILSGAGKEHIVRDVIAEGAYQALYKEQLAGPEIRLCIAQAVEQRQIIENGLSQNFARSLMQCSNNGILVVKPQFSGAIKYWKIEVANANCRNFLARGVIRLDGQLLHDVVSPSLYEDLDMALTQASEQGDCRGLLLHYEMATEERWLQFDGIQSAGGIAAILTDMTQTKIKERELETARATAQKLLDEKTSILGAMCKKLPVALRQVRERLDAVLHDGKQGTAPAARDTLTATRDDVASLMTEVEGFVCQAPSAGFAYMGANYLTVLEMSPDMSAVVSATNGSIKFMNRIGRHTLGFEDNDDLSEMSFLSFVPEDYSVLFEENMQVLRGEPMRVPMHLQGKDRQLVDVELQVVDCPTVGVDAWHGDDLVLISAADTTRRNRASRRIIAREEQLRKIMDNVADAIVVVDQDGKIETVNRSTELIFGIPSRELISCGVGRLLGPSRDAFGRVTEGLETFLNGGSPARISGWRRHMGRRANHELFPVEMAVRDLNLGERRLFIGLIRDISERVAYEENIMYMATHDLLTTLANRNNFHDELRVVLEQAAANNRRFGLMFMDLDHFKSINNSYGHLVGDRVLTIFSKRLLRTLGERARIVARLSADEFVALIEDSTPQELEALAQNVNDAVQKPVLVDHHDIRISSSVGIAEYPDAGPSSEELIRSAEYAVRSAKDIGRGTVQVYDEELSAKLLYHQKLETALSTALEASQFQIYYQAKINLETNEIVGAEALLRWFHPEIGMVSPDDFIPLAEETGQIREIGAWVLSQVCRDLVALDHKGKRQVPIAVNLSAIQFRDGYLASSLRDIMDDHGISADLLEIELTESALVEDVDKAVETLRRLKDLGLSIAIDDFGSGYSSFGYLTRFPIDCLKIDRAFVRDIPFNKDDMTVTRAIVGMAKNLSLKIVAEGVETVEQANFLRQHHCDLAQGYLYSRPVPFENFAALLDAGLPAEIAG